MILDATALLLLLNDKTPAPRHPETDEEIPDAHERVKALVEELTAAGQKIIITAPVLAELMVKAENASSKYIEEFSKSPHFKMAAFDQKAAIEHAIYTREAIDSGDKRGGVDDTWPKVKFDRQIVAIACSLGIGKICTDDEKLEKHAKKQDIEVVRLCDIQLLKQENLFPEEEADKQAEQQPVTAPTEEVTISAETPAIGAEQKPDLAGEAEAKEKGDAVVKTAPPSSR